MDSISALKLADLKQELRARNLAVTGTKPVLVARLLEAMSKEKQSANDDSNIDDLLDEDSMLGDEESDADDNEAADLTISSPTALVPPTTLSPTKKPEAVKRSPAKSDQNGDGSPPSKKKIILNREPVPDAAPQILPVPVAAVKPVAETKQLITAESNEKAVITVDETETTAAVDKLKKRQEKFGLVTADKPAVSVANSDSSDKMKKRSERFGVVSATAGAGVAGTGKVALTTEDEAKIAKRKERFGAPADEKTDELKQKRAARFGLNAKTTQNSGEVEEKKKLRAARFAAAL